MPRKYIESKENPEIKFINSLKSKKKRQLSRFFLVEGIRLVGEALTAQKAGKIYCTQDIFNKLQNYLDGKEITFISEQIARHLTETKSPQGIFTISKFSDKDFREILKNGKRFIFLHDISDPGNLGTLIRTAHSVKTDGLFISKKSADLYNPKTVRATMGSIFNLQIAIDIDPLECIELASERKLELIGLTTKAKKNIYEINFKKPSILFIGSEAHGLTNEIVSRMHLLAKIPMPGLTESLNASIAGSIAMMEFLRQPLA